MNNNISNNGEEYEGVDANEDINNKKITIIKLNESPGDNNSNNETITFNNSNNENISSFLENKTEEVIIEQDVFVKEEERVYTDDVIYLTEIQDQILASYPVSKQSLVYIQELAKEMAKEIIDTVNIGTEKYNLLKNNIKYKLIYDYVESNFDTKWVIPIVYDKHRVYATLKEEDSYQKDNENDEIMRAEFYFTETLEDKRGVIEDNQIDQHVDLKELIHQAALGKINYKNYVKEFNNLVHPYIDKIDNNNGINIGYLTTPKKSNTVLRYFNYNNHLWETRNVTNKITVPSDILDENKKIKGIKEDPFIAAENINIVGFMVIPFGGKEMTSFIEKSQIFAPENYENYLNKPFIKVGEINNIYSSKDEIIIQFTENHNLKDAEKIYVDKTNSFPNINSVYQKTVRVIDENNIAIKSNIKIIDDGSSGVVYKTADLKYDLYGIDNGQSGDIIFKFLNSNYDEKNESTTHNKIYLFNERKVSNKEEFKTILNLVFPTLETIINSERESLSKCYTIEDVNKLLHNYGITIDDLFYEQVDIIKNILTENMNNLIKSINEKGENKNKLLNFHLSDRKLFEDNNYYLSNIYINNPEVIKYYGKYPHFGLPEDSSELRLKWVQSQKDLGELFFLNLLLLKNKTSNKKILDYLSAKKNEFTEEFNEVNKTLKREKNSNPSKRNKKFFRYQPYIVTEKDIKDGFESMKKKLKNGDTIFIDNNIFLWNDGKQEPMTDVPDNTFALVGKDELWVTKNNVWSKSDMKPTYDDIVRICMLDNIDISDITLDDLEYLIQKDTTCKSKSLLRIEERFNLLDNIKNNYALLEEYQKEGTFVKNINKKINNIIDKYYLAHFKISKNNALLKDADDLAENMMNISNKVIENINEKEVQEEGKENEEIKYKKMKVVAKKDNLHRLLENIYKIQNQYDQMNIFYDLLDKDGLLVGKDVYSKKFKRNMNVCGHHIFFKNAYNSTDIEVKNRILKEMLDQFSDNGETEKNIHCCVNCGEFLLQNDFDDTEGFNNNGAIIRSRFVWGEETDDNELQGEKNLVNIGELYTEEDIKIDCQDVKFKEVLINNGLSIDNIDEAIEVCGIISDNFYIKCGVRLSNKILINIIIECIQKINELPNYNVFRLLEIRRYQEKGFGKGEIEKIDAKGLFKSGYNRFRKNKKYSIIAARFLIAVQTTIPPPRRLTGTSVCPFVSFYGDDGLNFMACVMKELNIADIDTKNPIEFYKKYINDSYEDFKKSMAIKVLFKEKKMYDIEVQKKRDYYKYSIAEEVSEIIEVPPLPIDFKEKLFNCKTDEEHQKLRDDYYKRYMYLIKSIKQTIRNVIDSSGTIEPYIGLPELVCCMEQGDEYINYYNYIQLHSDVNILDLISETNLLFEYSKLFINYGVFDRVYFMDPTRMINIYYDYNLDNVTDTSEEIIKIMFETYVDEGEFSGTRREYIGTGKNLYDLKSGKSKQEILEKSYSMEQYEKLLKDIENANKIIFIPSPSPVNQFAGLKKRYETNLENEIKILIKNISSVLKLEKGKQDEYADLLRNLGLFNDIYTIGSKVKTSANKDKYRFDYIKKVYTQYLIRYSSMIKNNVNKQNEEYDLHDLIPEKMEDELRKDIHDYYNLFERFYEEGISRYFSNIHFEIGPNEVQKIFANDSLYNYTYNKILSYSEFNFNDAGNVMLYILVNQLNKMIIGKGSEDDKGLLSDDITGGDDDDLINKIEMKTLKAKYICEFIVVIFELIKEDNETFNVCTNQTEKFRNNLIHEIIDYKAKLIIQDDDFDYFSKMLGKMSSKPYKESADEYTEQIEKEQNEIDTEMNLQDKVDEMKQRYTDKHGKAPTEEMLEEFKQTVLDGGMIGDDPEVFDPEAGAKGVDVLDQGAGYSEFTDFDFETGDGFIGVE